MGRKTGYLLTVIGTALSFGGTIQTIGQLGATREVLFWGLATIFGLFVLGRGVATVLATGSAEQAADPENAIGKTDSRFGRR